jgi:hypothetical protein
LPPIRRHPVDRPQGRKKGFGDLLDALALLPKTLHWRFEHIGAGELGTC